MPANLTFEVFAHQACGAMWHYLHQSGVSYSTYQDSELRPKIKDRQPLSGAGMLELINIMCNDLAIYQVHSLACADWRVSTPGIMANLHTTA